MSPNAGDSCAKYNSENDLILQQLFIGYRLRNLCNFLYKYLRNFKQRITLNKNSYYIYFATIKFELNMDIY